jgi:hypothetical protein
MFTIPADGARSSRLSRPCSARAQVEQGLLALAAARGDVRLGRRRVRLDRRLELAQTLLGVGERQLRLLVLDARHGVALVDVELRPLDVVPGPHERRRVLLLDELGLRARLLDLGVRLRAAPTASPRSSGGASTRRTARRPRPAAPSSRSARA